MSIKKNKTAASCFPPFILLCFLTFLLLFFFFLLHLHLLVSPHHDSCHSRSRRWVAMTMCPCDQTLKTPLPFPIMHVVWVIFLYPLKWWEKQRTTGSELLLLLMSFIYLTSCFFSFLCLFEEHFIILFYPWPGDMSASWKSDASVLRGSAFTAAIWKTCGGAETKVTSPAQSYGFTRGTIKDVH